MYNGSLYFPVPVWIGLYTPQRLPNSLHICLHVVWTEHSHRERIFSQKEKNEGDTEQIIFFLATYKQGFVTKKKLQFFLYVQNRKKFLVVLVLLWSKTGS